MAIEMRHQVITLMAKWRRLGHELGFGVGIAHGYATLGRIGFEGRYDYGAVGPVVNLAARLCADAKDKQILIDSRVFAAIEQTIGNRAGWRADLEGVSSTGSRFQHLHHAGRGSIGASAKHDEHRRQAYVEIGSNLLLMLWTAPPPARSDNEKP
jgi:class 3 adenylate cyclase